MGESLGGGALHGTDICLTGLLHRGAEAHRQQRFLHGKILLGTSQRAPPPEGRRGAKDNTKDGPHSGPWSSASPFGPSGAAGPAFSLRQCRSVGRSSGLGSPACSPFPQALQWRWSGPPPYGGGPARALHPLPYSPGLFFRAPAGDFFLIVPNLGPSVNEKARRRVRRAKEPDYLGWVSRWNFSR